MSEDLKSEVKRLLHELKVDTSEDEASPQALYDLYDLIAQLEEEKQRRTDRLSIALIQLLTIAMKSAHITEIHTQFGQIAKIIDGNFSLEGIDISTSGATQRVLYSPEE